ncbi:GtrA family protein [Flaviaesturariibacter amylovorans]|uniref:GtrA/DPMS transmembrane domain-containing protein n=1 Tax=Flaviaesturariibacter amylovorans TaxID=1084520 RepID=A0ABP8GY25_9BACT
MKRVHRTIRKAILQVIDLFYPPFRKVMTVQMFRYAACGGGNTVLNILVYYIAYNFVLEKQVLDLGFIAFTPHIAAFLIAFCITFPIGFYLSMFVVFQGSYLKRRVQLWRYFLVAMACVVLNYVLLKVFVEILGMYPTPSLMATTGIVVLFSYLSQRHFSFRSQAQG